jgi:hypothetical protein
MTLWRSGRGYAMQDYKTRFEKLISDAAECDLIGNLAADATKRASFRRLAEQFRALATQLKADMDGEPSISDREFLLRSATEFRELAASCGDDGMRDELLLMASDCERKAAKENNARKWPLHRRPSANAFLSRACSPVHPPLLGAEAVSCLKRLLSERSLFVHLPSSR